jgi:hypothetical protein
MKCEDVSAATKWTKKYNIHYHGALPPEVDKTILFLPQYHPITIKKNYRDLTYLSNHSVSITKEK